MDLTKLSDDELLRLYRQPDARADMPAAGAEPVAQRAMPDVANMSDAQLMALYSAPDDKPGAFESGVRGVAQGLTFGYGDELKGAIRGGIPGIFNGEGFQAGYERVRDATRTRDKEAAEAHPYLTTGGKIVGNVAGTVPAVMASPGLFGLGAGALGARMAAGAVGGGILGAAQGFGEGEGGVTDQLSSTAWGGVGGGALGGVAPAAGQLVGRVARPAFQALADRGVPIPGYSNSAARLMTEDVQAAGGADAIRGRMAELGPDARVYHAAPSLEGSGQGLAVRPETRELVTNDVRGLRSGSNDRLAADLDASTFPARPPSQIEADFARQRENLGPLYGQEERAARALTPDEGTRLWDFAEDLASTQKGAGRQMLDQAVDLIAPWQRSNGAQVRMPDLTPEGLMATRRSIDGMLARVEESAQLQREGVGMKLTQLRQAVDDQVRAMNPRIKDLDRAFETSSQSSQAAREGLNFMARDVHPADVAARFEAAPIEQQAAERLGARARIDREVGNTNRDLVALKNIVKSEGTWNRDKLATYFGQEGADRIFNAVDREAAFEETARRLIDNSQTAQRTAAAERFRPRGEKPPDPTMAIAGASGGPKGMAMAAAIKGFKAANSEAATMADVERNKQIGRFLLMQAGPELGATLDALGRRAGRSETGRLTAEQARMAAQILMLSQGNDAAQAGRRHLGR